MIRGNCHLRNLAAAKTLVEDSGMTTLRHSPERIRLPLGFSFAAVSAGIKVSGRPDLALVEVSGRAPSPVQAEREPGSHRRRKRCRIVHHNRVVAAPVEVGRAALLSTGGRVRAVVVNSGNANCATGRAGIQACERVCRELENCWACPLPKFFLPRPASSEFDCRRKKSAQSCRISSRRDPPASAAFRPLPTRS